MKRFQLNNHATLLRKSPVVLWYALMAALLLAMCLPAGASAQSAPQIRRDTAVVVFPDEVKFNFEFQAAAAVEKVTLLYSTNARTCQNASARQNVEFEAEDDWTSAEWSWDLYDTGGLPPGALLRWQWQVITADGVTFTAESHEITIEDLRYNWHKLDYGGIAVHWIEGNAEFGQSLQEIALGALSRLSREMGIPSPEHVRLMVYPDSSAVQSAGVNLPEWTGGFAVPEYNTILLGIAPGELDWARSIIAHELAHLVSEQRSFNCKGADMPTWLSEGISVVAEGPQDSSERELVLDALEGGRLPELRSLANGFAASTRRANLAYAQSGMLVRYFIDTYGADGMDRLLQGIQDGLTIDRALENVAGLDTEGLDAAWRTAIGYGETAAGTALPAATRTPRAKSTAIPTLALWTQAVPKTATAVPATPSEMLPTNTIEATQTITPPAESPDRRAGAVVWPYVLAGLLLLAAGAMIALRRTFRR